MDETGAGVVALVEENPRDDHRRARPADSLRVGLTDWRAAGPSNRSIGLHLFRYVKDL